jgi:iron complex outermembrane receptor protein
MCDMKQLCLFVYAIMIGQTCLAQADTLWLKEATVVAHRWRPTVLLISSDSLVSNILNHRSIAENFERENYLYNRNYGGGGIQTPGLRGLSAQQTAVLWNGVPVTNAMLGVSDLSLMPAFIIGEATLEPGPSSSVNGTGALGGTIYLHQTIPNTPELKFIGAINSLYNAFAGVSMGYRHTRHWSKTSVSIIKEQNRYSFNNRYVYGKPNQILQHAHVDLISAMHETGFKIGKKSLLNIRLWGNFADREIPPTMLQQQSKAEMRDRSIRTMAEHIWFKNTWRHITRISLSAESNQFIDPLASIDQSNEVQQWFVSSETEKTIHQQIFSLSLRALSATGRSAHYVKPHLQQYIQAGGGHIFKSKRDHFTQQTTFQWMFVNQDLHPFAISSFSNYTVKKGIDVFLNLANGFRIPTLNERFWNPGGNPNLLSEKSLHAALGYRISSHSWQIKQQYYYTPTENLVRWIPEGAYVTPKNIDRLVYLFGAETELMASMKHGRHEWRIRGSWHLNFAHEQIENYYKQLDYVPYNRTYLELKYGFQSWVLLIANQYTSARAVQGDVLPDFSLWFMDIGYNFKKSSLYIDFNNLFKTQYELIALRPMPGFYAQIKYVSTLPLKQKNI